MSNHGNRDTGSNAYVTDPIGTIHITDETAAQTFCGQSVESDWLPDTGGTQCRECRSIGRDRGFRGRRQRRTVPTESDNE